jgi:hypothetical protein
VLEGGGDEFLDGEPAGIEADGVGRAGEWGVLALGILGVAVLDDVGFALRAAALGADFGVGVDVEFVGRLREDDRADVAAFHDERGLLGEGLLLRDEEFPDGADLRDLRDAFVDAGLADMREGIDSGDAEGEFAVMEEGFHLNGGDFAGDGVGIGERDVFLLHVPGDAAVHEAGVDVGVADTLAKCAGESAFARGSSAVDGDYGVGGHQVDKESRTQRGWKLKNRRLSRLQITTQTDIPDYKVSQIETKSK